MTAHILNKGIIVFSIAVIGLFVIAWESADYSTPENTFEVYKKALFQGNIKTYMECLTDDSKQMLSQRLPQLSIMLREYRDIARINYQVKVEGLIAVLEFNPASELAPPYLFKKKKDEWKIDLKSMSEEIFFDQENHWHWKEK